MLLTDGSIPPIQLLIDICAVDADLLGNEI
jgi:hypothetical protein